MSFKFPKAKAVSISEIFGKELKVKAVCFDNKGKGDFGIFLASVEGEEVSFITSAKIVIGSVKKLLIALNKRFDYHEIFYLEDTWDLILTQKKSNKGKFYIDYEAHTSDQKKDMRER